MNHFHLEQDGRDHAHFDSQGGLGKIHQLFGEQMDDITYELNQELVA
jgi:type I restriction enzyme R subunit